MKTTHRSIPNDTFIVEEGKRVASILTQWDRVVISIGDPSDPFRSTTITFDQFYMALEAIIADPPLSPPSEPDKAATAPAVDANQAAPEPIDMSRWNWTHMNGLWHVCESNHHRSQDCEWRPATVKELIQAVETGVIKETREENHV